LSAESAHVLPGNGEVLLHAMRAARRRESVVSFDPNVRAHLWKDLGDLRALCQQAFPLCDIVKLSEDELEPCLGVDDPERALDALHALGARLACVTLGERGAIARRGQERAQVAAPQVEVIDTTGAGDGFVAGLLASDPLACDLRVALERACFSGSAVCTRLGAVAGLPRASIV
jgi:fructokinase